VFAAARSGQAGADAALASVVEDSTLAPIVRATALELLGRSLGASSLPVVSRGLDHADPMIRAAAASTLEALEHRARLDLLAPLLRDRVRGVRIAAARSLADVPVDLLSPSQSTAMDRAVSEYVATQKANAERAEAQINLGLIYSLRGLLDQAESALENALEIDPGLVALYVNLADLYRQQGRDQEGEALLRQASVIAPEDGDVYYALGLLLVRRGRTEEAVEALRSAADLSPETARYSYAYAMALHSAGDSERALEVLADAHARLPGDPELLLASVTLAREMGDLERAITYAQRLVELRPRDPEARQLLEELEAEVR
jgi:tetratricopeptide (TPR) repeat protein